MGRFEVVFKKMFNISEVYTETIEERVLNEYDTVFHFSLEVPGLINQKYEYVNI